MSAVPPRVEVDASKQQTSVPRLRLDPSWPASWQLSHAYDEIELWDSQPRSGYFLAYKRRRAVALRAVGNAAGPGSSVLDVAAAQGNFSIALNDLGYRVTWNDIREELTGYVALKAGARAPEYCPGNVFDLRDLEGSFDVVLMTEVIEHVAHPDEFMAKIAALVKPGGHIVMTTPNGEYFLNTLPRFSDFEDTSEFEAKQFAPNSEGHIFLLHQDEVTSIASEQGLEIVDQLYFTNPLTSGHIKLGYLLRVLPLKLVVLLETLTSSTRPSRFTRRLNTQMLTVFQKPKPR